MTGEQKTGQPPGGGYPYGLSYLPTLQSATDPAELALVALTMQRTAPDTARPFRYAELGCGHGVTLAALAACWPEGQFDGYDYLPEHIVSGRMLAAEAGRDNLRFHEGDFEALSQRGPEAGRYDFVVLHGVWSWVSEANRRHLLALLDRWVAPGGLVYVSYNACPFWLAVEPVRRIMRAVLGDDPGADDVARAQAAVEHWLARAGDVAGEVRTFWEKVRAQPDRYLIHEFGADHARAFWPSEIREAMSEARLSFVGQAELVANFGPVVLSREEIAWISEAKEAGYGAVAEDLATSRSFRADVFARGAPVLADAQVARRLAGYRALRRSTPEAETGPRQISPKIAARLDEAFGEDIRDVAPALPLLDEDRRKAVQALLLSAAMGKLDILMPGAQGAGAAGFNRMARTRWEDGAPLPGLICARRCRPVRLSRAQMAHVFDGAEIAPEDGEWLKQFEFALG